MTVAMAAFAVTDALIKRAAEDIGAMQCLMVISLLSLFSFLPLVWKAGDRLLSAKALGRHKQHTFVIFLFAWLSDHG